MRSNLQRTTWSWALLAALACACSSQAEPAPPTDVVLIVIDTLRADALTCYGAAPGSSPRLDALAADGVRFVAAQSAAPWTGPSVSALLTGRYPDEVGVHGLMDPLPASVDNLAQRMLANGYRTGAVVSNNIAGAAYGHGKGYEKGVFKRYKGREHRGDAYGLPIFTADHVTDTALSMYRELAAGEAPVFLYVHYTDPHEPYLPPEPYRGRALSGLTALTEEYVARRLFLEQPPTAEEFAALRALYAGEVAFVDAEVGRFLDGLDAETLVIVTADHGEEFREHGQFLHGQSLHQELLHVPLIVRGRGLARARVVQEPVSLVDVLPTVLELCGLPEEQGLAGLSLAGWMRAEPATATEPRILHAVVEKPDLRHWSARRGRFKLINDPVHGRKTLYDLDTDPGEQRSLKRPAVRDDLGGAIRARRSAIVPIATEPDPTSAAQRREALRSIGYAE